MNMFIYFRKTSPKFVQSQSKTGCLSAGVRHSSSPQCPVKLRKGDDSLNLKAECPVARRLRQRISQSDIHAKARKNGSDGRTSSHLPRLLMVGVPAYINRR